MITEPGAIGKAVRVQKDKRIQFFGSREQVAKPPVRQFISVYVGTQFDTLESQVVDDPVEFRNSHLRILHRQPAQAHEAVWMSRGYPGDFVVYEARRGAAQFRRKPVVVLQWHG